jgi:hypothetical protein
MKKRSLVMRFLALEIGPMVTAGLVNGYAGRLFSPAAAIAALAIFTSVWLSIREGVVLKDGGKVCVRGEGNGLFWLWILAHALLGAVFVAGSVLTFSRS